MDVGGTHIDCVAVSSDGARSEFHHKRPTDMPPEENAPEVAAHFIKDLGIGPKELATVAAGWKHGRNHDRTMHMLNAFGRKHLKAEVFWDAETAFYGALPERVGIVAISGTGSVVYSQTSRDKTMYNGGWSPLLGDPGSAFALGQQAIMAALRSREGTGPKTALESSVPDGMHMKLDDVMVLADAQIYEAVPRIASLAPMVFQLAQTGDVESVRIRDEASQVIAEHLAALARVWPDTDRLVISYAGRLMYAQPQFRQAIQHHLQADHITFEWREPQFRPPFGAILRVYPEMLGALAKTDQSLDWHHPS